MVSSMDLVLFFYNYLPTKKFLSILAFKCYDGIVQEDGPEVIKSLEEKTCGVTIVDCIKYSGYINRSEYFVTFYYCFYKNSFFANTHYHSPYMK